MKMTFGKFKGIEIREIEKSYLTWLLTLSNLDKDLRSGIETFLKEDQEAAERAEEERKVAAQAKAESDHKKALEVGISFSVNKEDNVIYVQFPFALKNDFRREFKTNAQWQPAYKMWCVAISTRNINKMRKLGYKEVETFEYKTYEVKASAWDQQKDFEALCIDLSARSYEDKEEIARKYFGGKEFNLKFYF